MMKSMLKTIKDSGLFALQFLTIFPVKLNTEPDQKTASTGLALFPVVGLLLGLVLAVSDRILSRFVPNSVLSVLIVVILIVITGGLHQDGLADTFDALGSGKDKNKMLEIMRDSRIGTMGTLSLICSVLIKALLISSLPPLFRGAALIMLPAAGRWGMTLPLYTFRYAREEGKAKIFFGAATTRAIVISTIILVVPAFILLHFKGVLAAALAGAAAYAFARFMNKRLDGITGDTLGAVNEICEIAFLIVLIAIGK